MAALLTVKHNIEVAHRLSMTPGKCENIHGHSMQVELSITGEINEAGLLVPNAHATESSANKNPIEFGELKEWFRGQLDRRLDHHLLLKWDDEFAQVPEGFKPLPGLAKMADDPTTENIAKMIYDWAYRQYIQMELQPMAGRSSIIVKVEETAVNSATYGDF